MSLSNKEQGALMAFVVVLILVLGGMFLVWPQIKEWPVNKETLADRQAENQRFDNDLVREATIDADIVEAYNDSVSAGGFFYNEMNAAQADKTVRNFLLSAGARIKPKDLSELMLVSPGVRKLGIEPTPGDVKFPPYEIAEKADVASGAQMGGVTAEGTPAEGAPAEGAVPEGGEAPVVTAETPVDASDTKVLYDNYYELLTRMDATGAIDFFKKEEENFKNLTDTEKENRHTALVGAMADFLAVTATEQTVGAYDVRVSLYLGSGMFTKLQEAALANKIRVKGDDGKFTDVRKAIGITSYTVDSEAEWKGVSKSPAGKYSFTVTLYCVKPISKPAYLIQLEQQQGISEAGTADGEVSDVPEDGGDIGDDVVTLDDDATDADATEAPAA